MEFLVARTDYGPYGRPGFIVQSDDLETIRQPHQRIFAAMQARSHTVHIEENLVYLIRG